MNKAMPMELMVDSLAGQLVGETKTVPRALKERAAYAAGRLGFLSMGGSTSSSPHGQYGGDYDGLISSTPIYYDLLMLILLGSILLLVATLLKLALSRKKAGTKGTA